MRRNTIVHALCLLVLGQALQGCAPHIRLQDTKALPSQVNPGGEVMLHTQYTVSAPGKEHVTVTEVRLLFLNEHLLGELPPVVRVVKTGPYLSTSLYRYRLPKHAAAGTYTVVTTVAL